MVGPNLYALWPLRWILSDARPPAKDDIGADAWNGPEVNPGLNVDNAPLGLFVLWRWGSKEHNYNTGPKRCHLVYHSSLAKTKTWRSVGKGSGGRLARVFFSFFFASHETQRGGLCGARTSFMRCFISQGLAATLNHAAAGLHRAHGWWKRPAIASHGRKTRSWIASTTFPGIVQILSCACRCSDLIDWFTWTKG